MWPILQGNCPVSGLRLKENQSRNISLHLQTSCFETWVGQKERLKSRFLCVCSTAAPSRMYWIGVGTDRIFFYYNANDRIFQSTFKSFRTTGHCNRQKFHISRPDSFLVWLECLIKQKDISSRIFKLSAIKQISDVMLDDGHSHTWYSSAWI